MKYLLFLCAILLTTSSSDFFKQKSSYHSGSSKATAPEVQQTSTDSILQYLLTSTVNDFHTQRPSDSIRFRDVHFGHNKTAAGNELYMLCGKFLSLREEKANWIPFVIIKTSGYELYLGDTLYCKKFIQDNISDLSTLLQKRYDAEYHRKNLH